MGTRTAESLRHCAHCAFSTIQDGVVSGPALEGDE